MVDDGGVKSQMNGLIWMKFRFAISGSEVSGIFGQRLQLWMNHAYGYRKDIYIIADMLSIFKFDVLTRYYDPTAAVDLPAS